MAKSAHLVRGARARNRRAAGWWAAGWTVPWILLILPVSWAADGATPETAPSNVPPPPLDVPGTVPRFDTETETTHRRVTWDDFQAEASRLPGGEQTEQRPEGEQMEQRSGGGKTRHGEGEQARISTAIQSDPFDLKVTLINRGSPGGGQAEQRPGGGQTEHLWLAVPLEIAFYATMDKRSSGAGKGARTELLLAHEQGHFDLTEIAARRLAGSLGGAFGQGTTGAEARTDALDKIQRAYDLAVSELEEQHARYDLETSHGQSARDQRDWNENIARMLGDRNRSAARAAGMASPPPLQDP